VTLTTARQDCISIWDIRGRSYYGSAGRQLSRWIGGTIRELYLRIEGISKGMVLPVRRIPLTLWICNHCLGSLCSRSRISRYLF